MSAVTVTIASTPYPSYSSVADADVYLAGDAERYAIWAAADADTKARALVSATRLMQTLPWIAGAAPATDTTVLSGTVVPAAAAMLAADILTKPALASSGSTASNIKRVKAGEAEVEFWDAVKGQPLPDGPWLLLRGLIGSPLLGSSDLYRNLAPGASLGACSYFDQSDFRLRQPLL